MNSLNVGDQLFLVQETKEGQPNDVRLCHIGEVNGDDAVLVIKEAPANGTGKAVLRTLNRHFIGNPVEANLKARERSRESGVSFQLPTPELFLLLDNKLKRQELRTTLEDLKTALTTLDKEALSIFETEVNRLKDLTDGIVHSING